MKYQVTLPIVFLTMFLVVPSLSLAKETTIYSSTFDEDQGWVTDDADNFYWQASTSQLFARIFNTPSSTDLEPNRYFVTKTELDPTEDFRLTWDFYIEDIDKDGVVIFGLYSDDLISENRTKKGYPKIISKSAVNLKLVSYRNSDNAYEFNVINENGEDEGIGGLGAGSKFLRQVWYQAGIEYSRASSTVHFWMHDIDSGIYVHDQLISMSGQFATGTQYLGISMYPDGEPGTPMSDQTRKDGSSTFLVDNVELIQIEHPPSLLFLPGIQASRLYSERLLGTEDELWLPLGAQDALDLKMDSTGNSLNDIYTKDAIKTAYGFFNVYNDFFTYLDSLVEDETISSWEAFPYDWRYDVFDVVENGTEYKDGIKYPVAELEKLAAKGGGKVIVVGHSNGGLLAKAIALKLEAEGKEDLMDKIIFLASPQTGTPKTIGSLLHGYKQSIAEGYLLDDETAREVSRNLPGAYGLLPSAKYLENQEKPVVTFASDDINADLVNAYGETVDTVEELRNFMVGNLDGREEATDLYQPIKANEDMVLGSELYHQNQLDHWVAPPGVGVIEVVGTGLDTVNAFRYEKFKRKECSLGFINCQVIEYSKPVPEFTAYGDQTVTQLSAEAYEGDKETVYVDLLEIKNDEDSLNVEHANIGESPQVQDYLKSVISGLPDTIDFIYPDRPIFTDAKDIISVHSPVRIKVTDESGRTVTGNPENNVLTTEIPGSSYLEVAGGKYIIVPADIDYEVELIGEAEGSFTLMISELASDDSESIVSKWSLATVTPAMRAAFRKSDGEFSLVETDYDGDGEVDAVHTVGGDKIIEEVVYGYNDLHDTVAALSVGRGHKTSLQARGAAAETQADNDNGAAETKILESILSSLAEWHEAGAVSDQELENLNEIIDFIINN